MRKEATVPQPGSAVGESFGWGAKEERVAKSGEGAPSTTTTTPGTLRHRGLQRRGTERSRWRARGPRNARSPLLRLTGDVVRAEGAVPVGPLQDWPGR